jgi:hypothetical protein
MIKPTVRPAINPVAHRAAIDALEAQRAAYRRFARTVEGQRMRLNDGDGDKALDVGVEATRGFSELEEGARRLEPMLRGVREAGSPDQLQEMERRMQDLMREARQAETAIQNLSHQLEAWRDAYGRQLAELGFAPGAGPDADVAPGASAPGAPPPAGLRRPYVQPGFGRGAGNSRPTLIDKKG